MYVGAISCISSTHQSPGDTSVILVRGCVPEAAQPSTDTATPLLTSSTVHHDLTHLCRKNADSA